MLVYRVGLIFCRATLDKCSKVNNGNIHTQTTHTRGEHTRAKKNVKRLKSKTFVVMTVRVTSNRVDDKHTLFRYYQS